MTCLLLSVIKRPMKRTNSILRYPLSMIVRLEFYVYRKKTIYERCYSFEVSRTSPRGVVGRRYPSNLPSLPTKRLMRVLWSRNIESIVNEVNTR